MSEIITITREELNELIAKEVAKNILPRRKPDFRDVMISPVDVQKINKNYPNISEKVCKKFATQNTDFLSRERRHEKPDNIYTRRRYAHGYNNYEHYKIYPQDVHAALKKLALHAMGVTIIKDLDDDEFECALEAYSKLKGCFLEIYADRISAEEDILAAKSKSEV